MKKLRKKIILGVLASVTTVFALTVAIIYLSLYWNNTQRMDYISSSIAENNGQMPAFEEFKPSDSQQRVQLYSYNEESPYRLRYFTVFYNEDGSVSRADVSHIASVDTNSAIRLAEFTKDLSATVGYFDDYRFRISEEYRNVVMLDCREDLLDLRLILLFTGFIAVFFTATITVVFYVLSKRIVRPFEENHRMQKQFITDASHELKTPLAIISANAEVLAYKTGENEWIDNITTQIGRVSGLVNELLTLNRLEEVEEISDVEPVDLSALIRRTCDEFAEVFNSKHVTVTNDAEPNIIYNGNPSQMERLISVLVENASKYALDNGEVRITLKKDLRYTYLTVYNTCEIDPEADYKHLFDRFYRPDASRTSSTGGHGIGLSIAKRIVTLHGGTIEAQPANNGLTFIAKLSNKLKAK